MKDVTESPTNIITRKTNNKRLFRTIFIALFFLLFATLLDNRPQVMMDISTNNTNTTINFLNDKRLSTSVASSNFIVLLTCSNGFYNMFLNWLLLFERLQISNLPVYLFAEDEQTHNLCNETQIQHTNLTCLSWDFAFPNIQATDKIGANAWTSKEYATMMTHRPVVVQRVLKLGYNVIFSDVDVIWKRDPMPYIKTALYTHGEIYPGYYTYADSDDYIETVQEKEMIHLLAQDDYTEGLCPGFMIFMSCPATNALVNKWKEELEINPGRNQPAFNKVFKIAALEGIEIPLISSASSLAHNDSNGMEKRRVYFRAKVLPNNLFINGPAYSSTTNRSIQENTVVIHNNGINGYENKINRLRQWNMWILDEK